MIEVRPETARKLNAIHTMKTLIDDSGLNYAEFSIENLEDNEVVQIAKEYKTQVNMPSEGHPQYWCRIRIGEIAVLIIGHRKRVEFFDIKR